MFWGLELMYLQSAKEVKRVIRKNMIFVCVVPFDPDEVETSFLKRYTYNKQDFYIK